MCGAVLSIVNAGCSLKCYQHSNKKVIVIDSSLFVFWERPRGCGTSIHSESAPRSRSKASTYSHAEEKGFHLGQPMQADSSENFWVRIYQPFSRAFCVRFLQHFVNLKITQLY